MTDLIQRIVEAIIRQEGMPPTYTNPGNLRRCPWIAAQNQELFFKGFWRPKMRAIGLAGAAHVVALHIAEGNSLRQLIAITWAPESDHNDVESYISNVANWAQIPDVDTPLWTWI